VVTNRKTVCDFLLVINSNWHPISYCFELIADCYLNFGHCVIEPLWVLMVNVYCTIYLRFIGKRVVDFLVVLIELFSLAVTAEALRANID